MATFTNQAVLSYNGTTTTSNITTGELLEVLSATKTAVTGSYRPGDTVTYVISIVNAGAVAYTGLTVTDDLGAYEVGGNTVVPLTYTPNSLQYYVNGTPTAAPTVAGDSPLTITGINVPAGGNVTLIYETRANGFAPLGTGGSINNTASVSGGGVTPFSAEAAANVTEEALLTISKAISPSVVAENGRLTYTFVIQNTGNTEATADGGAIVTDTFDPILSDLEVTYNNTTWTENTNYTYNEATGEFATVAGQITVPAATYTQDPVSGVFTVVPGVSVLTVTGTV